MPYVEIDLTRILTFDISYAEIVILMCLLAILAVIIAALVSKTLKNLVYLILGWNARITFQQTAVPDYFSALRMPDLEELVDEEKMLLFDFGIQNMTEQNLRKLDAMISRGR